MLTATESMDAAGVPVLLRRPDSLSPAPLIVLWHGVGRPKSAAELATALPLLDVHAYRAYVDMPFFGKRLPPGGEAEVARRSERDYILELFMPMLEGALAELPVIVEALDRMLPLRLGRGIGAFGFSGGGGTTLMALAEREVSIAAAVTINAPTNLAAGVQFARRALDLPPYEWTEASRTAARRADPISRAADVAAGNPPPALLLLHGEEDDYFPPSEAAALDGAFRPFYEAGGHPQRLETRIIPGLGHHIGAQPGTAGRNRIYSAERVDANAAEWFKRYLTRIDAA